MSNNEIAYVLSAKEFTIKPIEIIVETLETVFPDAQDSEIRAWNNSLAVCQKVITRSNIPDDVQIILECPVPHADHRIDLVLTGRNSDKENIVVLVELKQWSDDNVTILPGKKMTAVKVKPYTSSVLHPATQVYGYKQKLEMLNTDVRLKNIKLISTVFLHNYEGSDICDSKSFLDVNKVQMFLNDYKSFSDFLSETYKHGDNDFMLVDSILYGETRPAKKLADAFVSILNNNEEYSLDSNQLMTQNELIVARDFYSNENKKVSYIIQGGPGTGKSIIAINLLAKYIEQGLTAAYITKNAAPRDVYSSILKEREETEHTKEQLFMGVAKEGIQKKLGKDKTGIQKKLDIAIVDEAHRLTAEQVKNIHENSKFCIFFTDDNQMVHCNDIGSCQNIIEELKKLSEPNYTKTLKLSNQHRCNGSDNYLKFIDRSLGINNVTEKIDLKNYDFRIFNKIEEFDKAIKEKNTNNNARILAGYCWKWNSRNKRREEDIWDIQIGNYKWKWNLSAYDSGNSNTWIIDETGFEEIGCIHTSQGLEVDYCGVIIGPDISIKDNTICSHPDKRASDDFSININNPKCKEKLDSIIKNTYRVLMTRGSKGCYIFCEDTEVLSHFSSFIEKSTTPPQAFGV